MTLRMTLRILWRDGWQRVLVCAGKISLFAACICALAEAPTSSPRRIPAWVPAPGSFASVSLNRLADVDPERDPAINPRFPNAAPWRGVSGVAGGFFWSNCVYLRELGSMGSLVMTMSGHNGYHGNEVYRYDVATRLVSRLTRPQWPMFLDGGRMYSDNENGELYADATNTLTLRNQPAAFQSYDHNVALPAGVGGSGKSGALLTTIRAARAIGGGGGGARSHILDLEDRTWSRFATNLTPNGPTFGSADLLRHRDSVYLLASDGGTGVTSTLRVLNLITRSWSTLALSKPVLVNNGFNMRYMSSSDRLMVYGRVRVPSGYSNWYVIHPGTGQVHEPGFRGAQPPTLGGGEWVESKAAFYYYEGRGETVLYKLTPTKGDVTSPWKWERIELTGTGVPSRAAGNLEHQARFRWVEEIDSFLWWAAADQPIQAFRLPNGQ